MNRLLKLVAIILYGMITSLHVYAYQQNDSSRKGLKEFEIVFNHVDSIRNKDLPGAMQYCRKAMESFQASGYISQLARSWALMASLYWQSGDLKNGIACHRRARALYMQTGEKGQAAYSLSNMGLYHYYSGRQDSAMQYYLQSIHELEQTGAFHELAIAQYNLGNYFYDTRNYSKASYYQERATAIAKKTGDSSVLISTLFSLGKINERTANYTVAYNRMKEALSIAKALNRPTLLGMINSKLCIVAFRLKKYNEAQQYGEKALYYAGLQKDIPTYMEAALHLSGVHEQTGNKEEEHRILKLALQKEKENSGEWYNSGIYRWLARASYKLGNHKRAYDLLSTIDVEQDSLMRVSSNRMNAELETKYQTAQKEKELSIKQLQIAQKDLQIQKNRSYTNNVIISFIVALLIASMLILHFRHKKRVYARELRSVQQQKELQLLQALMDGEEKERSRIAKDLHDGVAGILAAVKMHFSTITMQVQEVNDTAGYKQGMKLLDEASKEIRKTSHNLMPEVLLQHGLDEALARYCSSISNASSIMIEYDSLGNIQRYSDSFELSVYRFVQELLNNIIKHSKASKAVVQVSERNDILAITIEDNGVGFLSSNPEHEGMGLKSMHSRIKALNGKIEMESGTGNGVSAYLEFEISGFKIAS